MNLKYVFWSIGISVIVTLIGSITDYIFGVGAFLDFNFENVLSNLLVVLVLSYYVSKSHQSSFRLWLALFIIYYLIGNFNINIEALVFNVTDQTQTLNLMLIGIPFCIVSGFVIVFGFRNISSGVINQPKFVPRKAQNWVMKIFAGNFLYFIFYIIAGISMQYLTPRFAEFYADKIPSMDKIIITNMFFRGFVFVGVAILIDRTSTDLKWVKAVIIGSVFAVLGGIAPLIPSNEFMPEFIRVAHGVEVGISNFLYGICTFFIIRSKTSNSISLG